MILHSITKLIISVVVCELAGILGSFFTVSSIPTWYAALAKPELSPPNWVFGPVWTLLYLLMGIAVFLVWQKLEASKGKKKAVIAMALGLFAVQLLLNATWSIIFFGLQDPALAFGEIILLWIAIVWTMAAFYIVSKPAMWLLVPYILWVTFAGYLNYSIWQLLSSPSEEVLCTQEAKICPDGSYVGHTGPNCEFSACPGE